MIHPHMMHPTKIYHVQQTKTFPGQSYDWQTVYRTETEEKAEEVRQNFSRLDGFPTRVVKQH